MYIKNKETVSQKERQGLVSHILLQQGSYPGTQLAITWVDVAPGARQLPHRHEPEQVYVIIQGQGIMQVDGDQQVVSSGDMVYIPPNSLHGINNQSDEKLTYISASTPSWDIDAVYDQGDLRPDKFQN